MPQPAEVLELAGHLAAVYRSTWERIQAELAAIEDDPRQFRRRRRLRELELAVKELTAHADVQARRWFESSLPAVYQLGGQAAASVGAFAWSAPHLDAVAALAQDAFSDLLAATDHVNRTTRILVRELARSETLLSVTAGRTATEASRDLRRVLEERGVWAVTYRDGSRHGLAEYAEVVVRTKSAQAYNAGTLNHATAHGVEYFEVGDGVDCGWTSHDDSTKANGRIVTAAVARAAPVSHPNCRRSFMPRPEISSEAEARVAGPTTTEPQRADQADFERRRAETLRRVRQRERRRPRQVRQSRRAST